MKKITIIMFLTLIVLNIQAQDYLISFAGAGDTTGLTTVIVDNLNSGASITMSGGDVLHLISNLGIEDPGFDYGTLEIYPNPMVEKSVLTFATTKNGNAEISIVDITGKTIYQISTLLSQGEHSFSVSDIGQGIYILEVKGKNYKYSTKVISQSNMLSEPRIEYVSSVKDIIINPLKSATSNVYMQYKEGDTLIYKGIAGSYSTLMTDVPTGNKTVTFDFILCRDNAGNSYTTVKIGDGKFQQQVWMAQNLQYLPAVFPPSDASYDFPRYYVYDYMTDSLGGAVASPFLKENGVLYNWQAAMISCPQGWGLPIDEEWTNLIDYISPSAGAKLKERGYDHWKATPNSHEGTNGTGFSARGAGRNHSEEYFSDSKDYFEWLGEITGFWSCTSVSSGMTTAWILTMGSGGDDAGLYEEYKDAGFSVRCILRNK